MVTKAYGVLEAALVEELHFLEHVAGVLVARLSNHQFEKGSSSAWRTTE
jgi:hypothetical protein